MFYYRELFEALNKAKVDYAIYGGLAAILHGVHRTTGDVDIIIKMTPSNIEKLFKTVENLGYRPKLPVTLGQFKDEKLRRRWRKEKGMRVFSFYHQADPLKWIDICTEPLIDYDKVKKELIDVDKLKIYVISIQQLKQLKKKAGRPIDLADIDELNRLEEILKWSKK